MAQILTNGIDTHVLRLPAKGVPDTGEHPTVVLVHGLGFDSLASYYFTLAGPVSSKGVEVIAYDLRGHGRSSRPHAGYRMCDFVADLEELIDALDVPGPVHLVGNSFGGTLAFSYAVAHPERVASLVMIEAEPATELWSRRMSRLHDEFRQVEPTDKMAWVTAKFGPYAARLAEATGHMMMQLTVMANDTLSGPWLGHEQVRSVRCPMTLITGSESDFVDRAELTSLPPHCRMVVMPGYRHWLLIEAPRTVLGLLLSWIAEHHPARRSPEEVGGA